MTSFDDREQAFEAKFAHDEEARFRAVARRDRLLGEWAAAYMDLSPAETAAYCDVIVRMNVDRGGEEAIVSKLLADVRAAGEQIDEAAVRSIVAQKAIEARAQILDGAS